MGPQHHDSNSPLSSGPCMTQHPSWLRMASGSPPLVPLSPPLPCLSYWTWETPNNNGNKRETENYFQQVKAHILSVWDSWSNSQQPLCSCTVAWGAPKTTSLSTQVGGPQHRQVHLPAASTAVWGRYWGKKFIFKQFTKLQCRGCIQCFTS